MFLFHIRSFLSLVCILFFINLLFDLFHFLELNVESNSKLSEFRDFWLLFNSISLITLPRCYCHNFIQIVW